MILKLFFAIFVFAAGCLEVFNVVSSRNFEGTYISENLTLERENAYYFYIEGEKLEEIEINFDITNPYESKKKSYVNCLHIDELYYEVYINAKFSNQEIQRINLYKSLKYDDNLYEMIGVYEINNKKYVFRVTFLLESKESIAISLSPYRDDESSFYSERDNKLYYNIKYTGTYTIVTERE